MFRFILLGDSITQMSFSSPGGFGAHLANVYQRRADVYNRGYSGFNTNWILELLSNEEDRNTVFAGPSQAIKPIEQNTISNDGKGNQQTPLVDTISSDIPKDAVRLIVIFLGANDASCSVLNARQHVPPETFRRNLKSILHIGQQHCPFAKFILVAPPPVHHEGRLKYQKERYPSQATGELERTLELSGKYAHAVTQVAEEAGVPCFNVWQEMQEKAPEPMWHAYLSDGLHLSPSGNEFVGQRLVEIIQQYYPELAVHPCSHTGLYGNSNAKSNIPQHGPWHDEILDPQNYCHVFKKEEIK